MKKLINTVLLLFLIGTVSSCLKSGLDDLEAYNEAEITNLNFEYRWWDEAKDQMAVKTLNIEKQISKGSAAVKAGDVIEIQFGTKAVKVEVLDVQETVKKDNAAELYKYL